MGRNCSDCGKACSSTSFSRKQWLSHSSRCKDCVSRSTASQMPTKASKAKMKTTTVVNRNAAFFLSVIAAILGVFLNGDKSPAISSYYETWDDAPASWEEFGHDNDPSVCRVPILTVEEWEQGRYWEREEPVLVKNVTDGWPALEHWTKEELLRRHPDGGYN